MKKLQRQIVNRLALAVILSGAYSIGVGIHGDLWRLGLL